MFEVGSAGIGPDGCRRLVDNSPQPMGVIIEDRVVRANAALLDLVGRRASAVVGLAWWSCLGDGLADQVGRAERALACGARRARLEGPLDPGRGRRPQWIRLDLVAVGPVGPGPLTAIIQGADLTGQRDVERAVADCERRLRKLFTHPELMVSVQDNVGNRVFSTADEMGALGYSSEQWRSLAPKKLVHPDDWRLGLDLLSRASTRPDRTARGEFRVRAADGSWALLAATLTDRTDDPDIAGVVTVSRDITAQRRAEQLSDDQAAVMELIAVDAPLGEILERCVQVLEANGVDGSSTVYLLDEDRLELRAGRAPAEVVDWLREPPHDPPRSLCDQAMLIRGPVAVTDFDVEPAHPELTALARRHGVRAATSHPIISSVTGRVYGTISTCYPEPHRQTDHEHRACSVVCTLISIVLEREATKERISYQALHDDLTGLPNRSLLLDRLEHALLRRERFGAQLALLFCDLDRFKVVNDSLGHRAGDQLLVVCADRLREVVEQSDTVARFGGDEFVVLLEDIAGVEEPRQLAERLAHALAEPIPVDGHEINVTMSVGLAVACDHQSADSWLRDADAAMYRAKASGRNRVELFDTAMREAASVRLQIENDLWRAVERDELIVHYQPIIALRTGKLLGCEALVRWRHPVRGLLAPNVFIPVAEETGVIDQIGEHILRRATGAFAAVCRRLGQDTLRLGVNISARQLRPGLDELVADVCAAHELEPGRLIIELTETALAEEPVGASDVLERMHERGVRLAIDDFGTGHSTLARLGQTPFEMIKLDQTFVAAIGGADQRLGQIVQATGVVARALKLHTVAEGVETRAQLDYLRRHQFTAGQGYLFARPMPIEQLAALIAEDPTW